MPRFLSFLFPVIVVSLIIAACGGGDDGAPPAGGGPTGTATARPTSPPSPTATAVAVSTGEIKVAVGTLPTFLNPGVGTGNVTATIDMMYTHFIGTNPDGPLEAASGYFTSWQANPDSTVWTFKARDNLVYHNGEKAKASDAVYALGLALDPQAKYAQAGETRAVVDKLEAPDATTFIARLKKPDIFWELNFASRNKVASSGPNAPLPKDHIDKVGLDTYNKAPVGSGPFKFKEYIVGERFVTEAVPYAHFYFGVPKFKTMTLLGIPEEATRVSLLKTKGVDLSPVSAETVKEVQGAGVNIVERKDNFIGIVFAAFYPDNIAGYGKNPLVDERVRKALFWHAIDRQALVDNFLKGYGRPSMDYPITSWETGGAYVRQPIPAFDLNRSKQLLTEAGYANGFEMDMYNWTVTAVASGPQIMEALAVWWERIGLKVNRLPITGATFTQRLVAVYNKDGFSKPTVAGCICAGNRQINSPFGILQHNADSVYSVDRDPEGLRLGQAYLGAKTKEEYVATGKAYQDYAHRTARHFPMLFDAHDLWARGERVSAQWRPGRDSQSYRLDYAASLR